jgi:uncharacterized membrane protein
MSRNTSSNTGSAGCGYLLVLALIGWAVVAILPDNLLGAAACLLVWLRVRYHREAWMVLQWAGDLLAWTVVGAFMIARWLVFHVCAWINRHCRVPVLPAPATQAISAPPHPPPNLSSPPATGWKLKNRGGSP